MPNKFLLLISFLIFSQAAFSQVTTEPAIAVENQAVKIIFDATKGTGGLANYSGDVYAHTGVITDNSTSGSNWKYVIAEWTENIDKAKMTRTADNIYELEITPDIRSFYGVPDGEEIQQMAFVFRSADQTKEGKAEGNNDIFVDVVKEEAVKVIVMENFYREKAARYVADRTGANVVITPISVVCVTGTMLRPFS